MMLIIPDNYSRAVSNLCSLSFELLANINNIFFQIVIVYDFFLAIIFPHKQEEVCYLAQGSGP